MPDRLTKHEIDVLKMLDGKLEGEWGAWVSVCLEVLSSRGLCTPGPDYQITPAGRQILAESFFQDVKDFHEKFGLEYCGRPRHLPVDTMEFRLKFLGEELQEYALSVTLEDQLDALVDLVYVALGTAYLHGFDFDEAWCRVHAANMKKVRAAPDGSDSKRGSSHDVVKPPGWQPPDLSDLVQL
jgi:predicted HAD superfamily Cof-like phosphohydrolase